MSVIFDTLAYSRELREAIEDFKISTKRALIELEIHLKAEIQIAKADTIRWIGGMLVVQTAVIAALVKLL